MKITFFSNFLNHHQLPFCLQMYEKLKDNFVFVATESFNSNVVSKGFSDMNSEYSFCVKSYESLSSYNLAMQLAIESDVVVWGSAPAEFLFNRLNNTGKLTFRYSERLFKPYKKENLFSPANVSNVFRNYKYKLKPYYLLAASAYAPIDFYRLGFSKHKMFKWGYFPDVSKKSYDELKEVKLKNERLEILWVGRMLDLKRPEHAVYVAGHLSKNNIAFHLTMVADGNIDNLIALIDKLKIKDKITVLPALRAIEVRDKMEAADIFLFTSDYSEGWGAVLNEAMASGMAVIASHSIGSVGFMLKHNENGVIYNSESVDDLCEKALKVCEAASLREKLSFNAYNTISSEWNACVATRSLINLSNALIAKANYHLASGPCSQACVVPQSEMYNYLTKGK